MELMKNGLNEAAINRIASAFSQLQPNFDVDNFTLQILNKLETLELKERVEHIIKVLHQHLPQCYFQTLAIFNQLKTVWDHGNEDDPLRSFAAWPIIDYIAAYGMEHPKESLASFEYLTSLFSAEFAIRRFIQKYPDICHEQFQSWIKHDDDHVRRLVSEGTRPRLPWGVRLQEFVNDPLPNIPLLSHLKNDSSLYVRRSVANHLNDIAKDHPELVINTCKEWQKPNNKELDWLIKHATRTIVKQGHPAVFSLLGYTDNPKVTCSEIRLSSKKIKFGENIDFSCDLTAKTKSTQTMVIDYVIYFVKANKEQKAKVFKLKNIELGACKTVLLEKSFSFKAISTRKYYPGLHRIEILINGKSVQSVNFMLES